jgi:hypothetical protein
MKKNVCVIIAFVAVLFVSTGPVLADYTVTGALSNPGSSTYTGDLFALLNGSGTYSRMDPTNGTTRQYIEQDYVVATGGNGSMAVFAVGQINPGFGNQAVSITASGSQYNLSGAGQTVNNLTNITVVHTQLPPGAYPGGFSTQFTISGPGISTSTYNNTSSLLGGFTPVVEPPISLGPVSAPVPVTYTGVSLAALLSAAGVNTGNPDQVVIAAGTDGYYTVMSMSELALLQNADIVAYGASNGSLDPTASPSSGFAKTILADEQLMVKMGNINGGGRWISNLSYIEVESVPEPLSLLLFAPSLVGLAAMRRRFEK